MVYIGVEFRDKLRYHTHEFWALVPYEKANAEEEILIDEMLCDEFDQWVEDGVDPEWNEEQKEEYYEGCDWVWWYLDDKEIEEYNKIRSEL